MKENKGWHRWDGNRRYHQVRLWVVLWRALVVAILLILAGAGFNEAFGQSALRRGPLCMPHDNIEAYLAERYNEKNLYRAKESQMGYMLNIFVNEDTGTWSAVMTSPNDVSKSCIMSYGDKWHHVVPGEDT